MAQNLHNLWNFLKNRSNEIRINEIRIRRGSPVGFFFQLKMIFYFDLKKNHSQGTKSIKCRVEE